MILEGCRPVYCSHRSAYVFTGLYESDRPVTCLLCYNEHSSYNKQSCYNHISEGAIIIMLYIILYTVYMVQYH